MIDLFGYERDELMLLGAAALYCDPQDRAHFQVAIDRDGGAKDSPVPLVTKEGRNLSCLLTSSARRENHAITGYHGIVHDVTRERLFTQSIESALHGTIAALGRTVELRDSYTARH